jgi:threonylcarbamoyladenosine tRNA methylthiotransferase MtaB
MRTAAFYTLGCKLNNSDTERLKSQFYRNGFRIVGFDSPSNLYVINTCTVTGRADADSRQIIRRAVRRKGEKGLVVVTGCYAQRDPETLASVPGVDLVLGQREKSNLLQYVEERLDQTGIAEKIIVSDNPDVLEFIDFDTNIVGFDRAIIPPLRTRATLKIQDGCAENCTFCIIPKVRGGNRSRPLQEILDEARRFVDAGYREVALTGVNTGLYGEDLDHSLGLLDVVKGLEKIRGIRRIRLNSMEPRCVTDELIDFAANSEKICRHFHIPLQSGDDEVLKRMGRRYRTSFYMELIEKIDRKIPGVCFGADVMVGFPGENDDQFQNTVQLIEDLPLTYLHVFSYSEREGTPALRLEGRVHSRVKGERSRRLRELSKNLREKFHREFIRQKVEILVEGREADGCFSGLTDNFIRVHFDGKRAWVNKIIPVQITHVKEESVFGETFQ